MPPEPKDRDYFLHLFTAPEARCQVCGRDATISQWRGRHIEGLSGLHHLVMRDRRCPQTSCPGRAEILRSPEEHRFALKKDVVGFDVMFEIAERRLQDDLSFEEIRRRLLARGVKLNLSTVCDAFKRFVALTSCSAAESDAVRASLRAQGGMVVMIDGVQFDDRSPVLYVVVDTLSRTPLFAERHAVRSKAGLAPLLRRLKAMEVPIRAFVTDCEKGLVPAIREVFPDVPHQFCQLHFLKRCAAPLDRSLKGLGTEVDRAAERLRGLRRRLVSALAPVTPEDVLDRELADGFVVAALAASKRSGRAPFKPTALVRHDALAEVAAAADEASRALRGGALAGKVHIRSDADLAAH